MNVYSVKEKRHRYRYKDEEVYLFLNVSMLGYVSVPLWYEAENVP